MTLPRTPLPDGFDNSRAEERRRDPAGLRFAEAERAGVWQAIRERRDIRRFRPDPVPDAVLRSLLEAAHHAPSVGLMQPWRFITVREAATKAAMQGLVQRERLIQADFLDDRAREYLDLKLEGIREAPVSVVVCCDRAPGQEILGRHTIHDTDLYSTCLAIENLWLAARAEGIGIGWVSFYREDDLRELLGIPAHVVPVAWLCVGYPDERPQRPGLEAQGWGRRTTLDDHVHAERWPTQSDPPSPTLATKSTPEVLFVAIVEQPGWWRGFGEVEPADAAAGIAVRDGSDALVKPLGSLGGLETALERAAAALGQAPTGPLSTGILVLAGDHGVSARGVSLYPQRVSAQVAAAAARGETAIGVLARALGAELVVADLGLRGPTPPGVRGAKVAEGSQDMLQAPALTPEQLEAAVTAGRELGAELAGRHELVVLGEIGIGNTTATAALLAALTGLPPEAVCGRGAGLDAQGVERKREVVATALAAHPQARTNPFACLTTFGGLELAGLVGAILGVAQARKLVLLDGYPVGVAALAACRIEPTLRDYLLAGHRSAEPAHHYVLNALGLEPLLDLRMRLGEASGAALAVPLLGLIATLQSEMSRFEEAGVSGPRGV